MRKGAGRPLSAALKAAQRGTTGTGSNPMDAKRALAKKRKRKPGIGGGLAGRLRRTNAPRKLY